MADPESGPPGGSSFGFAFAFGGDPSQTFRIAKSRAAPIWGPSGGPRIGSISTKYVYGWGRRAAPVLSSFFGPSIFQTVFLHRRVRGGPILGSVWRTPNWVRRYKPHCGGFATWQTFRCVFAPEICAGGGRGDVHGLALGQAFWFGRWLGAWLGHGLALGQAPGLAAGLAHDLAHGFAQGLGPGKQAGQGRAGQGRAGQGRAGQGRRTVLLRKKHI